MNLRFLLSLGLCLAIIPHTLLAADSAHARALFKNPPRQYSTGPLWVWNDMLTDQQIQETLHDLAQQQVKQVWVHPRPGLMTPYLSAEWFRLWKLTLNEAARLDMNVWIYDENSYPSGFAGGFVPEQMPESRGRGLAISELNMAPKWAEDTVAVFQIEGQKVTNVSAQLKSGENPGGSKFVVVKQVRAGNSPWHGNRCYVNLLTSGVTEKFLAITLEAYRKEVGTEFGKRVPGVFTDEPNIHPAGGLPWSEELPHEFRRRWGYELLDHLPSLTAPLGDWQKVRHNYFQLLNEQFIEHWSKPYHDYCQSNHLDWTGHYWDHEWPNCLGVPDNMAMYAWHQRPAIDCLMNQYAEHTHAQFGNARMVKELSSIANLLGMPRTLCEVYGAGGWDLRFEDMKRIGDWLQVLGVNTLNQHLSYVTIRGARKRDHPQSFSYHEPWWDAYHISAQYLARLSAAMSQGEQINDILVIEPTTTAWMYQGDQQKLKTLGDSFFNVVMDLEKAQIEYDLGCEDVMARHGKLIDPIKKVAVKNRLAAVQFSGRAALQIGNRAYHAVVIPENTENLNSRTVDMLENLLGHDVSGQVICLGEAPTRVDGALSDRVAKLSHNPGWKKIKPKQLPDYLSPLPSSGFAIERAAGDKGILFHHRRQLADGEILLLVNTSIDSSSAGTLRSTLSGVERWDLNTGKTAPYVFKSSDQDVSASFNLPPCGSLLLFLSAKPVVSARPSEDLETFLSAVGKTEIRRLEPNVLTLDFVDVTAGGETKSNLYFYKANQFVWQKNGMARDPWDSAVQFKDELISRNFPAESGFSASYRFNIEAGVPTNLAIVIERPDLYSITCNGHPVLAPAGEWWLDKAFGRIPLERLARTGLNTLTIKSMRFTMFDELEPAYLLGNFALKPTDHGFTIVPETPLQICGTPESCGWNAQGSPFYSAGVAYGETFQLEKLRGRYFVQLGKWNGSVARVFVNGKSAGYVDAAPWDCDVTKLLRAGSNKIEVAVIGTLKNTLGPHHGSPPLGAAWPSEFQQGPETGPPPGNQYSTVSYGLLEPFRLKRLFPQGK